MQEANTDLVRLLTNEFIRRIEPNVAWGMAMSGGHLFPNLRGFWGMGSTDSSLSAYDHSEQGKALLDAYDQETSPLVYGLRGICPYVDLTAANSQFLYHADNIDFDIGINNYDKLILGGWFYFDDEASGIEACIGKWWSGAVPDESYVIYRSAGGFPYFVVTTDCTSDVSVIGADALVAGPWYFLAGRWTSGVEMKLWVGDIEVLDTYTNDDVPNTLCNSEADFAIGAFSTGAGTSSSNYLNGKATLCFVGAPEDPWQQDLQSDTDIDACIVTFWNWTKQLFA